MHFKPCRGRKHVSGTYSRVFERWKRFTVENFVLIFESHGLLCINSTHVREKFSQKTCSQRSNTGIRVFQNINTHTSKNRYFKVLEFGDEMNADLLAQVMGCDVKTGRKRGRTRCWTQAEMLARKACVAKTVNGRSPIPAAG